MGAFEDEKIYGIKIRESANDGSDFSNPDVDYRIAFLGEDGTLHVKDSAGAVTAPYSAGGFRGAKAYSDTTQTLTTGGTFYACALNQEEYDTDAFHDLSTNNSRITIPAGMTGYYRLTGYVHHNTSSGTNYVVFKKGGATYQRSQIGIVTLDCVNTTDLYLTAGDYLELFAMHTQAAMTIGDASNVQQQTFFAIEFLGS